MTAETFPTVSLWHTSFSSYDVVSQQTNKNHTRVAPAKSTHGAKWKNHTAETFVLLGACSHCQAKLWFCIDINTTILTQYICSLVSRWWYTLKQKTATIIICALFYLLYLHSTPNYCEPVVWLHFTYTTNSFDASLKNTKTALRLPPFIKMNGGNLTYMATQFIIIVALTSDCCLQHANTSQLMHEASELLKSLTSMIKQYKSSLLPLNNFLSI